MTFATQVATDSVRSQHESKFFQLPIEIRRCIYDHFINKPGYHVVSSTDGDLALTPCLGARLYDGDIGKERYPTGAVWFPGPENEKIAAQRLGSSWGPHWMCEEFWMGGSVPIITGEKRYGMDISSLYPALRLCRRIFEDIMHWVTAEADFYVTDPETLVLLRDLSPSQARALVSSSDLCFQASIANRIEKLSVFIRRPLAFFQSVETSSILATTSPISKPEIEISSNINPDMSLYAGFPRLRKLLVWLDHTGEEYWSVVNERAVLGPFLTAVAAYHSLDFAVVLPKTHPSLENGERHFLEGTLVPDGPRTDSPPGAVRRVWRQRFRVVDGRGYPEDYIDYIHDFPHLLGHSICRIMDMTDIEEMEARNWRSGLDTRAFYKATGCTNIIPWNEL